jgi:hypothetical protein
MSQMVVGVVVLAMVEKHIQPSQSRKLRSRTCCLTSRLTRVYIERILRDDCI